MEKYVKMNSPFTGGKVKEISTIEEHAFRKEVFKVHVRYYVCEDTGEKFTTTHQDELLYNDLYTQYRIKHNIPFPDEISAIRKKYGLNLSQISKILGFGANQYAQYENGQIPSESNGKLILAARDKNSMTALLHLSEGNFSTEEFAKIKSSVLSAEDDTSSRNMNVFFSTSERSIYNGYTTPDIEKLHGMVKFFSHCTRGIFPTKLNKMMFYADFINYSLTGSSISGLTYNAIKYGPVPTHYNTIYDNINDLNREIVIVHEMETVKLSCKPFPDMSVFTASEQNVLERVFEALEKLTTSEIIELSHKEDAWINYNQGNKLIPYTEAFTIKLEI